MSQLLRLLNLDQPVPTSPNGGKGHPTQTKGCRCRTRDDTRASLRLSDGCFRCGRLLDTKPRHDEVDSVL